MSEIILSDEEFSKLSKAPAKPRSNNPARETGVILSDDEISKLNRPGPQVQVAPEAGGMLEAIETPFKWVQKQIERPSAGFKSGISTMANQGTPMDAFKNSIRSILDTEKAPTATDTLMDLGVPPEIAGDPLVSMAADMTVFDPLLVAGTAAKFAGKLGELSKLTRTASERNFGKIKAIAGNSEAAIQSMEANKDALKLVLAENEITSNLRRPNDLKKILTGKSLGVDDAEDAVEFLPPGIDPGDFIKGGRIGKEAKTVEDAITLASAKLKRRGIEIDLGDKAQIIFPRKLSQTNVPGSGIDADQYEKISRIKDRYVGDLFKKGRVDILDLQAFKKKLGERLGAKDFSKMAASDPSLALEKEIITEMYLKSKGLILNLADQVGLGKQVSEANQKMQAYYTLDRILTKPASIQVTKMSQANPVMDALGAATKVGGGVALGANVAGPMMGIPQNLGMAGGAVMGAKYAAPEIKSLMDYLRYATPPNPVAKAMSAQMATRAYGKDMSQMSVLPPEERKTYDVTRAKSLIDSKLLPDSGFLLNNKDLFLQKLAIQRSPQEADDMRALLERTTSQKALKTMLAQFAYKNPDMFQFDDENRFDGIIQQDVDVAKAKNDIMRSKMGSREKARLIDALKNRQEGVTWPK